MFYYFRVKLYACVCWVCMLSARTFGRSLGNSSILDSWTPERKDDVNLKMVKDREWAYELQYHKFVSWYFDFFSHKIFLTFLRYRQKRICHIVVLYLSTYTVLYLQLRNKKYNKPLPSVPKKCVEVRISSTIFVVWYFTYKGTCYL